MDCICVYCGEYFTCDYDLYKWYYEFADYCEYCYDNELKERLREYNNYKRNNSSTNNNKTNSRKRTTMTDNNNKTPKKSKKMTKADIEKTLDKRLTDYFNNEYPDDNNTDNKSTNTTSKTTSNDTKSSKTDNKSLEPEKPSSKVKFVRMDLNDFFKMIADDIAKRNKEDEAGTKDEEENEAPDVSSYKFEWIGDDVKNIKDLIRLGECYREEDKIQTNLDLWRLNKCVPALKELDAMIGMDTVKDSIFYQIVFHLQKLDNENKDMHHTVIKGPPGVGKTQLTHIIAKIYKALGFLKTDNVISVKRDDLVAGYVGQTAIKTKKKLEEALGGVLLIDEAYSFGQGDGKDSFSKEAIDLLTSYLSEHGHEFICIIAGYKEALEKRFFSLNEGLKRRFNIHYEIEGYKPSECMEIYRKLVKDNEWDYVGDNDKTKRFFEKNKEDFPHFGGDMLTLFAFCKKAHSQRLLKIKTLDALNSSRKNINYIDLEKGYDLFMISKCENDETKDKPPFGMYC